MKTINETTEFIKILNCNILFKILIACIVYPISAFVDLFQAANKLIIYIQSKKL